jgi:hypothetical protein
VIRPRVADDFSTIRARMDELCRERARPRAADDFPTIRARMEELRRERRPSAGRSAEPFGNPFEALSRAASTSPGMKAVSTSRA